MLGYINLTGRGQIDRALASLADELLSAQVHVAGAVQHNPPRDSDMRRHMDLVVLPTRKTIRISQSLGAQAVGCQLDLTALTEVAGLVEAQLRADPTPALLIVNKFGQQEVAGRGFRTAISAALESDIPVIVGVQESCTAPFLAWAGDLAESIAADKLWEWCLHTTGARA